MRFSWGTGSTVYKAPQAALWSPNPPGAETLSMKPQASGMTLTLPQDCWAGRVQVSQDLRGQAWASLGPETS